MDLTTGSIACMKSRPARQPKVNAFQEAVIAPSLPLGPPDFGSNSALARVLFELGREGAGQQRARTLVRLLFFAQLTFKVVQPLRRGRILRLRLCEQAGWWVS